MLLTFSFTNFGPYVKEATFDMRAVASYKEHKYNIERLASGGDALKVAVVYGANASGKSQFVKAYACFRSIVLKSFAGFSRIAVVPGEDGSLFTERNNLRNNYQPYRFCERPQNSEFNAVFETTKAVYTYGFVYNASEIVAEWLYVTNNSTKRQSTIIERSIETGTKLGASVRRECAKYVPNISKDVLALSFFNGLALKAEVFNETVKAIESVLPVMGFVGGGEIDQFLDVYFRIIYSDAEKNRLVEYLNNLDLGIVDFTVEKNGDEITVWSHHVGTDGRTYRMPLELESDGTRKMIALYTLVVYATSNEAGLLIDELDAELHPLLLRYIVRTFHAQGARGQLVFTAHDLSILDKRYLRRDQVWFSSKDRAGNSVLRSLADFKVRNDSSFGDAYLAGVFGAVPNIVREEVSVGN